MQKTPSYSEFVEHWMKDDLGSFPVAMRTQTMRPGVGQCPGDSWCFGEKPGSLSVKIGTLQTFLEVTIFKTTYFQIEHKAVPRS